MSQAAKKTVTHNHANKHVVRNASSGLYMHQTLADPDIAPRVKAFVTRIASDREQSVAYLKKVGILNRSGKLSKNFGG